MRWVRSGQQRPKVIDLVLLLVALTAALLAAAQLPLRTPLRLAFEEQANNAQPFLRGAYTTERSGPFVYRWVAPEAAIELAVPSGAYRLTLAQVSGSPTTLIVAGQRLDLPAPLTPRRALLVAPADGTTLSVGIHSAPFPAEDERVLGTALGGGSLARISGGTLPPAALLGSAALLVAAAWVSALALRASQNAALGLGLGLSAALTLLQATDPLRMGLAPRPLLLGLGAAGLALLVLRAAFPRVARRLGLELEPQPTRWLLLATAGLFGLIIGGRALPAGMGGDLGFHINRTLESLGGYINGPLLISRHRGIDFPYPPAMYLLLAPLMLVFPAGPVLQVSVAALTALMLPTLALVVQHATGSGRAGLLAALWYASFPAIFMPLAWSFETHIFAQWTALLASGYLAWRWQDLDRRGPWAGLVLALLLVFVGHFGFFINMTLLVGLMAAVVWWRWPTWRRQAVGALTALTAAQALAWASFYSAYIGLFIEKGSAFAEGGMSEVNDRPNVARSDLLESIIFDGIWRHYALLPVLLAPLGMWLLARSGSRTRPLTLVIAATFAVSAALGIFPLLAATTISTRWLMFSAWGIAACCGVLTQQLLQRRDIWRGAALAALLFVCWWGVRLWLLAMGHYVRPPEPF